MSDPVRYSNSSPKVGPQRYVVHFLTDQWEWEEELSADTVETAKAGACEALLKLVHEERPELACVTLAVGGKKIGVWDWVNGQPYWGWL